MSLKRVVVAGLLGASLAGCAGKQHTLKPALRDKIASTEVYLASTQVALGAQFEPAHAGVAVAAGNDTSGLKMVLVTGTFASTSAAGAQGGYSTRRIEAEAYIKSLQALTADYPFDDRLRQQLDAVLSGAPALHARPVQVIKRADDEEFDARFAGSGADAVLFVTANYELTLDLSTLQVKAEALLVPRSQALRRLANLGTGPVSMRQATDPANAIYRNEFLFESRLPGPTNDKAANLAAWQRDRAIRGTLEHGVAELVALVAADLQSALGGVAGPEGKPGKLDGKSVTVLAPSGEGQRVRLESGALKAMHPPVAAAP